MVVRSRMFGRLLFILAIVDVGLSAVISTANCNFVRRNYNAELHLFYTYKIEFRDGSENQLEGTEIAIANAVAQALDTCDDMDRPLFAAKTGGKHIITGQDDSAFAEGNANRYYALGTTKILLDYFSAQAREEAYAAIRLAFKNATIIKIFDQTVVHTEYLHAVNEALVFPEEESGNGNSGELTVVVAIATGIVAFLIAALLCFALMHERKKTKAQYDRNHGFDRFESISSSRSLRSNHTPSNRSFSRLTNDFSSEYSYAVTEERYQDAQNYLPSTIWSVSDITSDDSGSIRSLLSRATTKLESIEEEEETEEIFEINHRRRNRRTMKEYDCFQFKKGAVYISNLAQCQDSLAMPKTEDLEVGMAKDLPILLGGTNADEEVSSSQVIPESVPEVDGSGSQIEAVYSDAKEEPQPTMDDNKESGNMTGVSIGSTGSRNGEGREEFKECDSSEAADTKHDPAAALDDGGILLFTPKATESDDGCDQLDVACSFVSDDSVARENAQTSSTIEDSAHMNHDIVPDSQYKDTTNETSLQIHTSAVGCPEVTGITPVTSNVVGSECMIDTGSPSIVKFNQPEEIQKETGPPSLPLKELEASSMRDSSLYLDELENALDRGNTSLYSLDMDETIISFIDDIIAAIDDSKLMETSAEQSNTSGSNETTLDDINTDKSDESFFVDDQSASDIEDSGRITSMDDTSALTQQPKRRFVLTDVTNSILFDELKTKNKPVASDEASDANTTYTL